MVYRNGDTFFGGYRDNKRKGLGLYVFTNGGSYAGDFDGGKRAGGGTMTMPDGSVYKGAFEEDRFHGKVLLRALLRGLNLKCAA